MVEAVSTRRTPLATAQQLNSMMMLMMKKTLLLLLSLLAKTTINWPLEEAKRTIAPRNAS